MPDVRQIFVMCLLGKWNRQCSINLPYALLTEKHRSDQYITELLLFEKHFSKHVVLLLGYIAEDISLPTMMSVGKVDNGRVCFYDNLP